jgi:hypothetical protein
MWRYNVRNEAPLAIIAEKPAKNIYRNVFGVILEASQPALLDDSGNYCVHFKIIDQTFNFTEKTGEAGLKFHKCAHVYVYTGSLEEAPKIARVGDLLRLYFARFYLSGKGELVCRTDYFCDWRVYTCDGNLKKPLAANKTTREVRADLTADERNYAEYLQGWSRQFLGANILKDMSWWNSLKVTEGKSPKTPATQNRVDLVVKLVQLKGANAEFLDKYGNKFTLKLPAGKAWKKDGFYRLGEIDVTSVAEKDRKFQATPTKYLIVNALPLDCKDVKNFGKKFDEILEEKRAQFKMEGSAATKSTVKTVNKAKNESKRGEKGRKPEAASVEDLQSLLKGPSEQIGRVFTVEAEVTDLFPNKGSEIVRKMVLQNRSVHPIDSSALKNLDAVVIFHFVLTLKGHKKDSRLPVYVNTSETLENPFVSWGLLPDVRNIDAWQNMKEGLFVKWENRIKTTLKKAPVGSFTVQLLQTKSRKPFLQIVNTDLWN